MVIDLRKEHEFPRVAELGTQLARFATLSASHIFPALKALTVDEAAVQIYPAGTELALGWHRDDEDDGLIVMSASLCGEGVLSFTRSDTKPDVAQNDHDLDIVAQPLSATYLRVPGLFEREDGSDIREWHAVTSVDEASDRFTIQYRMGVNAAKYNNTPINAHMPFLEQNNN